MKKHLLFPLLLFASVYSLTGQNDNPASSGTFADNRDDRTYKWVRIGAQTWMAENLAWLQLLSYGRNVMSPYQGYKSRGFSVRCLRY
jgi:hypothetical protein